LDRLTPTLESNSHGRSGWKMIRAHMLFRASMKNVSGHTVEWSMQSVSQYDTGSTTDPSQSNHQIWGFTPAIEPVGT